MVHENFMIRPVTFMVADVQLHGELSVPEHPEGLVVFVHGSGSSRFSPRNQSVARYFNERGLATLLFDLLGADEQRIDDVTREFRFDIPRLTQRLVRVIDSLQRDTDVAALGTGLFGASTGAAAALMAAAIRPDVVRAVVSRGGRVDLAAGALPQVRSPVLMIVGSDDHEVLALNRNSSRHLGGEQHVAVVQGATHLFDEPGTLEEVARLSADWFLQRLPCRSSPA